MNELWVINIARQAITTTLMVAGPLLGIGLLVGLVISIIQAVTQIQEQTLVFVPKILAILLTLLFLGPWMLRIMLDLVHRLWVDVWLGLF
ncbi:MAG TPA: flagellar biosynthesis protein FliQ [Firmicutes bacterium]|jgi:flagellar biosynthetic protein FliQ|nr:flagellar biosynthesis protein FliQ [Bacillota bacterium]